MARTAATERRIVTVLFADLVGFTALSEGLDAEDVVTIQDAYFAAVRETVERYGGRLEKFIGDAAMAVFGVPRVRDDDAERAVRAALALTGAVEQLTASFDLDPGALRVRVGVNSGEVVASPEAGPDEAMVTGDAVNVAARFQSAADPGRVLVGETTALAVAEAIELEPAGALELKGKSGPVRAWRAAAVRPERSREQALGGLRAPLLGRERELSALLAAFAGARPGTSRRLLVVAPPGVGKTRLVDELAARVEGHVLRARLRPDVLAPYDAVGQLLTAAGRAAPGTLRERLLAAGATAARASAVCEEVAAVVDPAARGPATPELDLAESRGARFTAWLEALDALASAPSLWLIEDAHWAGADLLAFLDAAGAPATSGRLVLATARPSLLEAAPAWCEARDGVDLLELPPLATTDAGGLVRALVGDALPASLVERIVERSDGNPLFVEELFRTWIGVGTLVSVDGGWRLARTAQEVPLPATVQALYAAQLDDLPHSARAVARRASVAGRRFPARALEPLGVAEGAAGIEVLRRRALVSGPHADELAGEAYAYRHALLRDAGYASLARAERAALHVRLAQWLAESAGGRAGHVAELVARHYAQALDSAPALAREVAPGLGREETARLAADWFEQGAEAALELSAFAAARSLFARALELTPEDDVPATARRHRRLGEVTATSADMDEGARELERALRLYRASLAGDGAEETRDGYARAAASLGRIRNEQVDFRGARRLADEALATLGERDDLATARLLLLRAVSTIHETDDVDAPTDDAGRALAIARGAGDADLQLDAIETLTRIRDSPRPVEAWREVERLARAAGRWSTAVGAMRVQAALLLDDSVAEALASLDAAAELAQARGLTEELAWIDYARVEAGLVSGDWDGALAAGRRALALGRANAYHRPVVRTWFALVPIAAEREDRALLREAWEWFEAAPLATEGLSPYARIMRTAMYLAFARAGLAPAFVPGVDERRESFETDHGMPSWLAAVETVVGSWLAAGELEGAQDCLDRLRTAVAASAGFTPSRAMESLLRARLLTAEDDAAASEETARALEGFRRNAAAPWIARALRLREQLGAASPDELAEAAAIERALGLGRSG